RAQFTNPSVPPPFLRASCGMAGTAPGVEFGPRREWGRHRLLVPRPGADQNNTVLNGLQFGGANLPRDAAVGSSLITSPYDVSRGGFSGAQFSLRTRPGSNFVTRGMSLNVDAPQMQWSDRATQSLGQKYSNLSLGSAMSGPIKMDKSFYNFSYQLGRRANDLQTLLTTNAEGLQAAGVSADSVSRFLGLLQNAGVPLTLGGIGDNRTSRQGAVFGSLAFSPPSSTTGKAFNVTFNGNWNEVSPASGLATELPSHSGD